MIPGRADAHQGERLRQVLAAGAQGRRGPEVHDDPARIVAMVLEVPADHLVGRPLAEQRGGPGRQGAGIHGREIAAGRHHVAASPGGRARGPGPHEAPVESPDQAFPLAPRAVAVSLRRSVWDTSCAAAPVRRRAGRPASAVHRGRTDRRRARSGPRPFPWHPSRRTGRKAPSPAPRRGSRGRRSAPGGGRARRRPNIPPPARAAFHGPRGRPAVTTAGVMWPRVTAASRRLAGAASPGSLTMNG